jgi:predicted ATPase
LAAAILRGGGVRQWIWLGDRGPRVAWIGCELNLTRGRHSGPVAYGLQFAEDAKGLVILREHVRRVVTDPSPDPDYLDRDQNNALFQNTRIPVCPAESVLAQFKNPADPTPVTEIANHFAQIRIFREFRTGPQSPARYGISTNAQKNPLTDGADNLALVLHELDFPGVHDKIRGYLRRFCERSEEVKVSVGDGLARAFLREAGLAETLSAIRMSDGTLKFLSPLAAIFTLRHHRLYALRSRRSAYTPMPCNWSRKH